MKGKVFIVTYFYWLDGYRKEHFFTMYSEEKWTLQEVESIAKEEIEDNDSVDNYYITRQEILASNI